MVINAIFNNISVTPWGSFFLMQENNRPGNFIVGAGNCSIKPLSKLLGPGWLNELGS
jgi:hypothetical protein